MRHMWLKVSLQDLFDIEPYAVIFEVDLIKPNPREWWIDTSATRHICSVGRSFTSYPLIENGENFFIGDFAISTIKGQGYVVLTMTYGKYLTLKKKLQVSTIQKDLVFGSLLNKNIF